LTMKSVKYGLRISIHQNKVYLHRTTNVPWQLPYRLNKLSSCMVTRKILL
jgi:hypothetical protein